MSLIPPLTNEYRKCTSGLLVLANGRIKWKKNDNLIAVYYSAQLLWFWVRGQADKDTAVRWSSEEEEGEVDVSAGEVVWSNSYDLRSRLKN